MPQKFYVGNYGGPLSVSVFAADGETPVLPLSATIDITNMVTGATIISGASCFVQSGLASYVIPSGSAATAASGRYVGYVNVLIETGNEQTEEVYYNVFEKTSYYILERWRFKVQDSSIDDNHLDDDVAREWIDQAVSWMNRHYAFGYTSVLGAVSPLPNDINMEFIASVGSLMARTAWWAGKGNWRDEEMSFDGSPFAAEWARLDQELSKAMEDGWYALDVGVYDSVTMYNRDDVYYDGVKYDSPLYWQRDSTDPVPDTEIPL